jgi:uncharacterized protein YecE (DUF72 family)
LLAQFPPSFINDKQGNQRLNNLIQTFKEYRLAVELRHRNCSDDRDTARVLGENNVAWVQIDEPKYQSSISSEVPLTLDIASFRFQGRNAEMWWKGNAETRYKYLYSLEEIKELAGKLKAAKQKTSLLFAFFNNHWKAYVPRNARDLIRALQLPFNDLAAQPLPKKDL